ncbi:restriction endonuclease [Fusobacterium ulcerans]|uniref:restriction endonuclease n=1 Tax=Fusobacterium ulcerans TaxID=861 RepID=UPI001D09A806|nr:restriction endonuclease [Fusobacterium ulcerans]MCB8564537.1 restriction endonuclease [Fusobacterium ulcerans]MCB8648708.1 restriction endonuclease [Fusobacterium ulcerans]
MSISRILNRLSKAQVITKDEDKVLDTELHTDLLNKSEREKIVDLGVNLSEIIQSIVNSDSGGDSDRTFIKYLPILSEVNDEIGSCKVYVQIKKKDSIYDEDEGINQLEQIVEAKEKIENTDNKFNNIYKVLVCTGEFSNRIKELAQEKNIILIDGIQLIRMCLKNI